MYTICYKCAEVFDGDRCPNCGAETTTKTMDELNKNAYMAVRYGYQYRKIAKEQVSNENGRLHYCLSDPSQILEWLAGAILSGITWDIIKKGVKKLCNLIASQIKLKDAQEKEAYEVLSDEKKLQEFYEYIIEYQEGFINISEKEYKYIEEEMMADFFAEEMSKVGISRTVEHYKEATFKAIQKIQKISRRQNIIK